MLYAYGSSYCNLPKKKPFRCYLKRKYGLCDATLAFWVVKVVNKVGIMDILACSKYAFCSFFIGLRVSE